MFLVLIALYSVPRHSNRFLQPLFSVLSSSSILQFHTLTSGTDDILGENFSIYQIAIVEWIMLRLVWY